MAMWSGTLEVEPDNFILKVEQMVVRPDAISFDCHGRNRDDHSPWQFSGVATLEPGGYYKVDRIEQIDEAEYETVVYLFKPNLSHEDCTLEGFWYERREGHEPTVWRISGSLTPF